MIGVLSEPHELPAIREFFELFKTPWEEFREGQCYLAVITTGRRPANLQTRCLLVYSSAQTHWDIEESLILSPKPIQSTMLFGAASCPLYGKVTGFSPTAKDAFLILESDQHPVGVRFSRGDTTCFRLGYDLFAEVSALLGQGQPASNAFCPALDRHISILRELILKAGVPLVEVPPRPDGHPFFACLTHDIDFLSVRQHIFDKTFLGFIFRASVGSTVKYLCGRIPAGRLLQNWMALLRLPLTLMGLGDDFWLPFERYLRVDRRPSTFFIIPSKNRNGKAPLGANSKGRAVKYDIQDIPQWVNFLRENQCEVALHGIDAWHDLNAARHELEIHSRAGGCKSGTRMHWLFFGPQSYQVLENAGFEYDATCGYNEAVGYRAGTAQVFKPLAATTLLELPFQIQDTALFYQNRMNLSERAAHAHCAPLIQHSLESGGVITLSWHDRSLAPERLWGDFYASLLQKLENLKACFLTANQIVHWFRARRAIRFSSVTTFGDQIAVGIQGVGSSVSPGFVLRISCLDTNGHFYHKDVAIKQNGTVSLKIQALQHRGINAFESSLA